MLACEWPHCLYIIPHKSLRSHPVRLLCFHMRVVDVAQLAVQWGQHLVPRLPFP